ncbi:MAG: hypothetical protein NC828_04425 [Candidatus Omnitrophica bacterium]|nr:hypothetical protein [Candidatus Omnitrophota bacterium]
MSKQRRQWATLFIIIIYALFFMPWFITTYSHQGTGDIVINGNLAYDFINKSSLPLFSYLHEPHLPGIISFQTLIIPLYKVAGKPYFFLMGALEFLIAIASILIWIMICKKIDKGLIPWFGIYAILMPPLFKWYLTYAWGTHPESVALQSLILFIFIHVGQNEFENKFSIFLLGLLSGFSVFFLIGNLTMVFSILLAWGLVRFREFLLRIPYFVAGFIGGVLPIVPYLLLYQGLSAFKSYFFISSKHLFILYNFKLFPKHLFNSIIILINAPLFKVKYKLISYLLIVLIGYIFFLFRFIKDKGKYIKKKFYLLPIVIYPIIFFVTSSLTQFFSDVSSFVRYRYYLPLSFIWSFLLAFLTLLIYKKSKLIGVVIGLLISAVIVFEEPDYKLHFKKLFNITSDDITKLKVYKGVDRYMLWSVTVPRFLNKAGLSYINLATKHHKEELWLVCEQLARWTYLNEPASLSEAFSFAKSNMCEDFFIRGLGFGLAEQVLGEQCRYSPLNSTHEEVVKSFEMQFRSKAEKIGIDYETNSLNKGAIICLSFALEGHIGCNSVLPYLKPLIYQFPLDEVSKIEALFEGYRWAKWLLGYPWDNWNRCLAEKNCDDLYWAYEISESEDIFYKAAGKALAKVYALVSFYVPDYIIRNEIVKKAMIEELANIGLKLGKIEHNYHKIQNLEME